MSSIGSINEPEGSRKTSLTPQSVNEPATLPEWATDPPAVTQIEPYEATIGDPDFRVYVSGTGFFDQSVIVFAGQDEPTTFEDGKLSTGVNMAVWHGPDTVQVGVRNGPIESNTMPFTFNAAPEADATAATEDDGADPDELEDELEQAQEEGDFRPLHRGKPTTTLPKNRKR